MHIDKVTRLKAGINLPTLTDILVIILISRFFSFKFNKWMCQSIKTNREKWRSIQSPQNQSSQPLDSFNEKLPIGVESTWVDYFGDQEQ